MRAGSKEWPLKDAVRYLQDGVELKPHPVKYAFLVRFLSPDQLQALQYDGRAIARTIHVTPGGRALLTWQGLCGRIHSF